MKDKILFCTRNIIPKICLAAAGTAAALGYPQACTRGIANGIAFCTEVLVPSLFFFMALTAYLIKSGIASMLSKPLTRLSQIMLRLPGESAVSVLLAMLGGYPIGAGCAAMFHEEGRLSESEAVKTAYVSVAAGPGFLINFIGSALLGSHEVGTLLLASQAAAVILTGVLAGLFVKSEPPAGTMTKAPRHSRGAFVGAIGSAGHATFSMCATVLIFSAVTEVAQEILPQRPAAILAGFSEITTGCSLLSAQGAPLPLLAFFIGFGGLAVHCQIFSVTKELPLRRGLFFLFRIIEGIITALLTYTFLMNFPIETAVFRSTEVPLTAGRSATVAGSAALILCSLCFVGSVSEHSIRNIRR